MKDYKNRDWLNDQYWNLEKSMNQIAKEQKCDKRNIYYWMVKFNIPRRSLSKSKENNKHPQWKGKNVGITALHDWIRKNKMKPENCEICGEKKKLELSNISGEYKRDVNDFQYICHQCHMIYDREKGLWGFSHKLYNIKKLTVR